MAGKRISLYIGNVIEDVDARGTNRSAIIDRDLTRLYELYRRNIPRNISSDEACLIIEATNGMLINDRIGAQILYAMVEDAIVDKNEAAIEMGELDQQMDKRWGVDAPSLINKLHAYSDIECMALVDAIERFWALPPEQRSLTPDVVRKVFGIKPGKR